MLGAVAAAAVAAAAVDMIVAAAVAAAAEMDDRIELNMLGSRRRLRRLVASF